MATSGIISYVSPGFDAPGFDAPAFDAPAFDTLDSKEWSRIYCISN